MKKLLLFLMAFIPLIAAAQFEAGEYMNTDTAKITGESIIYPFSDSTGQFHYTKGRDPSEDLDLVNLRTLFARLADLDSLGLLVSDVVNGDTIVNLGESQVYFPSAFDSSNVSVVSFVRRVSDDAVIDYSINDVDSLGFDIVVWEDNIKLSYIASQKISHSSDIFGEPIYSADSAFIKSNIRELLSDSSWIKSNIRTLLADSSLIKSNIRTWLADSSEIKSTLRAYRADSSEIVHYSGNDKDLNMTTKKIIGGTGVADLLKLQGTTGNGTLTSPAIQSFVGNNGGIIATTILNNGKVGIGTAEPGFLLDVYAGGNGATAARIGGIGAAVGSRLVLSNIANTQYAAGPRNIAQLDFSLNSTASITNGGYARIESFQNGGGSSASNISFSTAINAGNLTEQMRITSTGNVGIGTTAPTAVLHLKAGTAAASTAPLKLTPDGIVKLTVPEVGAIEADTAALFYTPSTFKGRKTLAFLESPVFAGLVTINGTTPASVATETGTAASNTITAIGGNGGATSSSASVATGGKGGGYSIASGNGGATTGTPTTGTGGQAGEVLISGGNGGVGTTFGGAGGNIELAGGMGGVGGAFAGVPGYVVLKGGNAPASGNTNGGDIFLVTGIPNGTGVAGSIYLGTSPSYTARGNVGIGMTETPSEKLEVAGNIKSDTTKTLSINIGNFKIISVLDTLCAVNAADTLRIFPPR